MLNAIILDDEDPGRKNLEHLVSEYCSHIRIVATCSTPSEARDFLARQHTDIIFLDIMMPGEDGFEFLRSLSGRVHLQVVFVTAHADYALKAIKASAVDYLLKPVKISELVETEKRLLEQHQQEKGRHDPAPLRTFLDNLDKGPSLKKIIIRHRKGFNVIDLEKVIRLEADGNYTTIFTSCPDKIITSKSIKDFEDLLDPQFFVRVHKSHIINLRHLEQYAQNDTGYALLTGGHKVEVSRRKSSGLFDQLANFIAGNKNS